MNDVNKTLYIPLYGKAYVSKKGIILNDPIAEEIWEKETFKLKGKSKSKWLAYYMAMRSSVYDEWLINKIKDKHNILVLHIGCGMDSRIKRLNIDDIDWYDIDFLEVIKERRKYYKETDHYHMLSGDIRNDDWLNKIDKGKDVIVILEGLSMYLNPYELNSFLSSINKHFNSVRILMDCYSERAAKLSKYKNPINDIGKMDVYGYDDPLLLASNNGYSFIKEHLITPQKYIDELKTFEKFIFQKVFSGKLAKKLYRMYEFEKI